MTKDELFATILAPTKRGAGVRVGFLGDTGQGKSTLLGQFLDSGERGGAFDIILIHDTKDPHEQQIPGGHPTIDTRTFRDEIGRGVIPKGCKRFVFRGVALSRDDDKDCSPGELSQLAWSLVLKGRVRVCVVTDELSESIKPNSQLWENDKTANIFRKGRSVGISCAWATLTPQSLPREAFGLSESIILFRMSGREAKYLEQLRVIDKETAAILPTLKVGEFIVFHKSDESLNGMRFGSDGQSTEAYDGDGGDGGEAVADSEDEGTERPEDSTESLGHGLRDIKQDGGE